MLQTLPLALLLCASPSAQTKIEWSRLTPANTGIPGDTIVTMVLGADDRPWIGGHIPFWEQGGLSHWDGRHWTTLSSVEHAEIESPRFYDMAWGPAGRLWIGTEDGLLSYDPAVGPDSLLRFDETNTPIRAMEVVGLDFDPTGALWLAIDDNETGFGGLARFEPAAGTWEFWDSRSGLPWGAAWPGWDAVDFVACLPDPGGFSIWFGSGPMGMAIYRNGEFQWFGTPDPASPTIQPFSFMSADPVDDAGNAWMMTSRGLARRNPDGTFLVTGFPAGFTTEVSVVTALEGGRADRFVFDRSLEESPRSGRLADLQPARADRERVFTTCASGRTL